MGSGSIELQRSVGGPERNRQPLLDSNLDWGKDLADHRSLRRYKETCTFESCG